MINIETEILYFLRDSMFRIGELGYQVVKLIKAGKRGSREYEKKMQLIFDLIQFNQTLFSNDEIYDPQYANAPNYFNDEKAEVTLGRLHFYRDYAGLSEVGYVKFQNYQPVIDYFKGVGTSIPQGVYGQVLGWDINNNLTALTIDQIGGSTFNISDLT